MNGGTVVAFAVGAWLLTRMGRARAAPTPLPPAGAPGEPALYEVRPGDSLPAIARDELGDLNRWRELAAINQLRPPYVIQPGQQLLMPTDYGP